MENFNHKDSYPPPPYEINETASWPSFDINSQFLVKEPDQTYEFGNRVIADFIPFINATTSEDWGYILLRANEWLRRHAELTVLKCEVVSRMIDSRGLLDQEHNCYVLQLVAGIRVFSAQLRLHCWRSRSSLNDQKREPDFIEMAIYVPKRKKLHSTTLVDYLLEHITQTVLYESQSEFISRINDSFREGLITGSIINAVMFYLKVGVGGSTIDNTRISYDYGQSEILLRCIRIFYKPGPYKICDFGMSTFLPLKKEDTLDSIIRRSEMAAQLLTKASISVCSQVVPIYKGARAYVETAWKFDPMISEFRFGALSDRSVRCETVVMFNWRSTELRHQRNVVDIFYLCPRKVGKIMETYKSFMNYAVTAMQHFDSIIIDTETLLIPNSLSWKTIRHQTTTRYEHMTNANIKVFVIKLMLNEKWPLTKSNLAVPLPIISESKFKSSGICAIL